MAESSTDPYPHVRVQTEDFDVGAELRRLRGDRRDIGAVASFVGLVRDINEGSEVGRMYLEHYPGMTEKSIEDIVEQAMGRWELIDALVIHRVGALEPCDQIVLVAVCGGHRGETFQACEFIMDYLQTQAPFWKKETTAEGQRWVQARQSDRQSAERWRRS